MALIINNNGNNEAVMKAKSDIVAENINVSSNNSNGNDNNGVCMVKW